MPALTVGSIAPEFSLPNLGGKKFDLKTALQEGPVLLAFFKVSCPTCQMALPFLERIHRNYGSVRLAIVGVSQNDAKDTADFLKKYAITFPVLLDETKKFPVSNAYGLTNVPTLFWIAQDGTIEISSVGWARKDVEDINRRVADETKLEFHPLLHPGEQVVEFRAG